MVGLRLSRDFLANAEADDPGEDVSVWSLPSVDDFLMEFGDFFSLDGVRAKIEPRRELSAEDFGSFSSTILSSVRLCFFLVTEFPFYKKIAICKNPSLINSIIVISRVCRYLVNVFCY